MTARSVIILTVLLSLIDRIIPARALGWGFLDGFLPPAPKRHIQGAWCVPGVVKRPTSEILGDFDCDRPDLGR